MSQDSHGTAGSVIDAACNTLRSRGFAVEAADDIPGLWTVNGREVTIGQLLDIARQTTGDYLR